MSFKYDYVPVDELQDDSRLPSIILAEGEATFEIVKVFDKEKSGYPMQTKAGDSCFKLMLAVTDSNRRKGAVWHTISAKMPWAIKALADAIGMPNLYSSRGEIDLKTLEGHDGQCEIATQEASGQYKAVSVIKKYLPNPVLHDVHNRGPIDNTDDDLPF